MEEFDNTILNDEQSNKKYLVVATEKYWSYFQKSA